MCMMWLFAVRQQEMGLLISDWLTTPSLECHEQTWSDYNTNVIDYDYDYIVSNHDYNCLKTPSERKQNPFA